jgi:chromosome condensin MukBEF complex kleisin-like MukF subunit
MPPCHASNAILALINYWIKYSNIVSVIVIAHFKLGENRHVFKGMIARPVDDSLREHVLQLVDSQTEETNDCRDFELALREQ